MLGVECSKFGAEKMEKQRQAALLSSLLETLLETLLELDRVTKAGVLHENEFMNNG